MTTLPRTPFATAASVEDIDAAIIGADALDGPTLALQRLLICVVWERDAAWAANLAIEEGRIIDAGEFQLRYTALQMLRLALTARLMAFTRSER